MATDPEATSASLAAISRAGARATAELREMLQVLRPVGSPGEVPAAPPSPAVALSATASLDDLVASARDAGVHVELEYDLQDRDGGTGRLDPAVRLTVVRTVQEALTNTLRHSGPGTRVRVAVRDVPDGLLVEVVDDGKRPGDGAEGSGTDGIPAGPVITSPLPPTEIRAGNGLVGLAERAAALGGTLRHGPRPDRGYGVLLRLPLTPPSVDLTTGWTTDLAIGQAEGQIIHGGPR